MSIKSKSIKLGHRLVDDFFLIQSDKSESGWQAAQQSALLCAKQMIKTFKWGFIPFVDDRIEDVESYQVLKGLSKEIKSYKLTLEL